MEAWEASGLVLGIAAVGLGIAIRLGLVRGDFVWYDAHAASPDLRHGPFALIPFGLFFLFGVLAARFARADVLWAAAVAAALAFASVVAGMFFIHRPPPWMKPRWLRVAESRGEPVSTRFGATIRGGRVVVPRALYFVMWAMLLATPLVIDALGLPWYAVFAAVGSGLGVLFAITPRQ